MGGNEMITLSPFYHSAVNAVTEPNRLVFCSRYLIERWSPLLGGTGLQILLYLRTHCFHDRRTGECRDQWQVSRAEIARAVGVSEATVKRELAQNEALRRFVRPQQEYRLDGGAAESGGTPTPTRSPWTTPSTRPTGRGSRPTSARPRRSGRRAGEPPSTPPRRRNAAPGGRRGLPGPARDD